MIDSFTDFTVFQYAKTRKGAAYITPIFSEIDKDLSMIKWNRAAFGYGTKSIRGVRFISHRVVCERMIGRKLEAGEIVDHANHNTLDKRPSGKFEGSKYRKSKLTPKEKALMAVPILRKVLGCSKPKLIMAIFHQRIQYAKRLRKLGVDDDTTSNQVGWKTGSVFFQHLNKSMPVKHNP